MELTLTLKEYLEKLSSNSPTPGGGNVAALCGTLSANLGTMVCNLTIGKKKYAEVEGEMSSIKKELESMGVRFTELAAKDNAAFDKVMEAFGLPKETEEQKELRSAEIENATLGAAEVPSEVIRLCSQMLPLLKRITEIGNKNSVSDAGVAALLAGTASGGAFLNVLINCSSLKNQTIAAEILKQTEILNSEIKTGAESINQSIIKELRA